MAGCMWDNSLDVVAGGTTGNGTATIPFPIPNLTGLAGVNLYNQAIVLINEQGSNGFNM